MISTIDTLEKVLMNIQPFNTKKDIVHEIQSMLNEAYEELHRQEIEMMEQMLNDETLDDETRNEIRQTIEAEA